MNKSLHHPAASPALAAFLRNSAKLLFYIVAIVASALFVGLLSTAQAQEPSTTYRGTSRDPFVKYRAPVRRAPGAKRGANGKPLPPAPTVVEAPELQQRIDRYKALKVAAMSAQQPAPKPVTALLLSEVVVTGIFRTPRGYAAMVEATPIKLSYVIYPGENFFDGQLVAVEENRLVFRREKRYTDGKRELLVETKPLRPANAVANEMIQTKQASEASANPSAASAVATVSGSSASGNPQ
jgi:hypothetical protein